MKNEIKDIESLINSMNSEMEEIESLINSMNSEMEEIKTEYQKKMQGVCMFIKVYEFNMPEEWEHDSQKIWHSFVLDTSKIKIFAEEHPTEYSHVKPILDHLINFVDIVEVPKCLSFGQNPDWYKMITAPEGTHFTLEYAYMVV